MGKASNYPSLHFYTSLYFSGSLVRWFVIALCWDTTRLIVLATVFLTFSEVGPDLFVKIRFIRIPTPATACINSNVLEGVEVESLEHGAAEGIMPVPELAMPHGIQVSGDYPDPTVDYGVKSAGLLQRPSSLRSLK